MPADVGLASRRSADRQETVQAGGGTLLIVGATSILKQARRGVKLPSWIISLMARRPYKVVAVALANKIARTIWALLVKGGTYRAPAIMARA